MWGTGNLANHDEFADHLIVRRASESQWKELNRDQASSESMNLTILFIREGASPVPNGQELAGRSQKMREKSDCATQAS